MESCWNASTVLLSDLCHDPIQSQPLTLQAVELASAVLSRDVLPIGTAGQGHHGAEGHGSLAHLHLKLQSSKLMWRRQLCLSHILREKAQPHPVKISNDVVNTASPSIHQPALYQQQWLTQVSLHGHTALRLGGHAIIAHQSSPLCSPGPALALLPLRGVLTQAAETETGSQWKIGKYSPFSNKANGESPNYFPASQS